MDREAWWDTVHGVAKSRTRLSLTHTHTHTHTGVLLALSSGREKTHKAVSGEGHCVYCFGLHMLGQGLSYFIATSLLILRKTLGGIVLRYCYSWRN